MKNIVTVKNKITSHSFIFNETLHIYRKAVNYIINVCISNFSSYNSLNSKLQINLIESLIHNTANNVAKYDFDSIFIKFPSYLRRSAIADALGSVASYMTKLSKGEKVSKPTAKYCFPVLYKGNMYEELSNDTVFIKVYHNKDWVWLTVKLQIKKNNKRHFNLSEFKKNNPTLIKDKNKYFLAYSYEKSTPLNNTKIDRQKILSVDLGLTNSAVCCVMDSKGTVLARKFISCEREKDLRYHYLKIIKKNQKISGFNTSNANVWRKINNYSKEIINKTCSELLKLALKHNVSVIVFEHLGNKFRAPKGIYGAKKLNFKLQYWNKQSIQKKLEQMAHIHGIRIRRVLAKNTSKLAFDGSGEVKRNYKKDICVFRTGKQYHADLNASYNIGARYIIKEYIKTYSVKNRSLLEAKVPLLVDRSSQTLSTLISMLSVA